MAGSPPVEYRTMFSNLVVSTVDPVPYILLGPVVAESRPG